MVRNRPYPQQCIPENQNCTPGIETHAEILQETHHDMTAFLVSVAESIGPESRFIHLGLTLMIYGYCA